MDCKCIVCGKNYVYNNDVGYDKRFCSSYCDGKQASMMKLIPDNMKCTGKAVQTVASTIIELWIIDKVLDHFKIHDGRSISISKLIARELYKTTMLKQAITANTSSIAIICAANMEETIEYTDKLVEGLQIDAEKRMYG